jgi:hypothetical protein
MTATWANIFERVTDIRLDLCPPDGDGTEARKNASESSLTSEVTPKNFALLTERMNSGCPILEASRWDGVGLSLDSETYQSAQ